MVESQIQDNFSFKYCATLAYVLCNHFDYTHAHVANLTKVDPRFELHDENSSSHVNQVELYSS